MEQKKRGRPKIYAEITEAYAPSRRQAIKAMYMYEAVCELSVAATEIPNHEILWYSDSKTKTAGGKHGIMEQLGRVTANEARVDGYEVPQQIIYEETNMTPKKKERNNER